MANFITSQAGNWSQAATWGGGGVPGSGDTAEIRHAVTVDVNTTVGLSNTLDQAGTGTVALSGTSVTGTGTAFLSQLKVGDTITVGGSARLLLAISSDTAATIGVNTTVGNAAFTFSPRSVWVNGPAGGSVTVAAGITLTVRGDLALSGATLLLAAGAGYLFDSSLVAGTPVYRLLVSAGEATTHRATVQTAGTAGSRCAIGSAGGSGAGQIRHNYDGPGGSLDAAYTDFSNLGGAGINGISLLPAVAGQKLKFDHCTFANCGKLTSGTFDNCGATVDLVFTANQWLSTPADPQDILTLSCYAATTGLRQMTDNVMALPDKDCHVSFGVSTTGWTVRRNIFGRVDGPMSGGNFALFDTNLFYIRHLGATTLWSFVGTGGDTLSRCYVINDEGPAQANEHQLMANDNPAAAGSWTLSYEIFERSGLQNVGAGADVTHAGTATQPFTLVCDHCLVLPMANGWSSGHIRGRGNASTTYKAVHCTLMTDPQSSGLNNDGALLMGNSYSGFAGMVGEFRSNLCWSRTASPGGARGGYAAAYDRTAIGPVADLLAVGMVDYNAHYNSLTGTLYDASGANGTSVLGYDGWRQTTKPALAHDVNLGTGSNEVVAGPRFLDPSRNFATFDTAYLTHSAAPWLDGHAYSVGDTVQAQTVGWYNGAPINYRCVKAHTANSADSTNGKPGAATSYRTNWEFATAYSLRQAVAQGLTLNDSVLGLAAADYLTVLWAWVRAGFAPRNPALGGGAHDQMTIGAVALSTGPMATVPPPALVAA